MKNKSKKLIYIEEYVTINGIEQYFFHSGTNFDNPVMLFLHGGPGSAESVLAYAFQEKWEYIYTVVHYDQRGAGKTLKRNPYKYPTIDLMLQDLFETIQYLKKKYNKQKIVLLGHSWGSVLGSIFIKKYPEEIAYYIGANQVVSMFENECIGYEKVKELIIQSKDSKSLRMLEEIGEYPVKKINDSTIKKLMKVRKLQGKYNLGFKMGPLLWTEIKSPIFQLSDLFMLLVKAFKANKEITEFLFSFSLMDESSEYKVPIYYILGDKDWQAPYVIAEEYYKIINASKKNIYIIPDAGHMSMLDKQDLFFDTLLEINKSEAFCK